MKHLILFLAVLFSAFRMQAQTLQEWTEQAKIQKKYLLEQLTALRVLRATAHEGYELVKEGLNMWGELQSGDFLLHASHFASFNEVNPRIKGYSKVAGIIGLQKSIIRSCKAIKEMLGVEPGLLGPEAGHFRTLNARLLQQSSENLEELARLLTDGAYSLSDEARIKRIDALYGDQEEKATFLATWYREVKLLVLQRNREARELEVGKRLH